MGRIIFVLFIFLLSIHSVIVAQFDAQVSNYWAIPCYYNPSYMGQSGKLELIGFHRMQWIGITHAPKTNILSVEMPFSFIKKEHGMGLSMYNDQIGLFNVVAIFGRYIYKCQLFNGNLNIGIRAGYINKSFNYTEVNMPDYTSNNIDSLSETRDKSIDASLGIYYNAKNWHTGFSIVHFPLPKLELKNSINKVPCAYFFTSECSIQFSDSLLEMRPSILMKLSSLDFYRNKNDFFSTKMDQNPFKNFLVQAQLDLSLKMIYNKMFWTGLSWRKDESVIFVLGGKFKIWEITYAYDVPLFSNLRKVTLGGQELLIKYTADLILTKKTKTKYKHKSVRIL